MSSDVISMQDRIEQIKKFETRGNEFEFVKFRDLSLEEQEKHRSGVNNENDLVIIQKSFNPGFNVFPIKDSDFIGFIINKLIEKNGRKGDLLRNPFSTF